MILRAGITTFICLQVTQSLRFCVPTCHTCPAICSYASMITTRRLLHHTLMACKAGENGRVCLLMQLSGSFINLVRSAADACLPATSSLLRQALLACQQDANHLFNASPSSSMPRKA